MFFKTTLFIFICIILFGLFGGRLYQEYYIRDFSTEWKQYARSYCNYTTLLDTLPMPSGCCLDTIKTYDTDNAVPTQSGQCANGYKKTEWLLMCSGIPACYPVSGSAAPAVPTTNTYKTDDFGGAIRTK